MSPVASKAGSQKKGTAPARNVTSRAEICVVASPATDSTSVITARSAPMERCGSKNSLIDTRASLASNCRCEYWRSSFARATTGIPLRSWVRITPSTIVARFVAKS